MRAYFFLKKISYFYDSIFCIVFTNQAVHKMTYWMVEHRDALMARLRADNAQTASTLNHSKYHVSALEDEFFAPGQEDVDFKTKLEHLNEDSHFGYEVSDWEKDNLQAKNRISRLEIELDDF